MLVFHCSDTLCILFSSRFTCCSYYTKFHKKCPKFFEKVSGDDFEEGGGRRVERWKRCPLRVTSPVRSVRSKKHPSGEFPSLGGRIPCLLRPLPSEENVLQRDEGGVWWTRNGAGRGPHPRLGRLWSKKQPHGEFRYSSFCTFSSHQTQELISINR